MFNQMLANTLRQLPRQAIAAFAVRCSQRVQALRTESALWQRGIPPLVDAAGARSMADASYEASMEANAPEADRETAVLAAVSACLFAAAANTAADTAGYAVEDAAWIDLRKLEEDFRSGRDSTDFSYLGSVWPLGECAWYAQPCSGVFAKNPPSTQA